MSYFHTRLSYINALLENSTTFFFLALMSENRTIMKSKTVESYVVKRSSTRRYNLLRFWAEFLALWSKYYAWLSEYYGGLREFPDKSSNFDILYRRVYGPLYGPKK